MPETEVDAEHRQHAPGDECSARKDDLVVGREHRRQEHREQAGEAEHDTVEQLPVALLLLEIQGLPEIETGKAVGRQLGDIGDGLAALDRQPEDVGAVALDALRGKARGIGHSLDPAGIEVRPDGAGADDVIAIGGEPKLDRLFGRVGQCEDQPVRIGAERRGANAHAAGGTVEAGGRIDLQAVAAAFVRLTEIGDLQAIEVAVDGDGFQRRRRRCPDQGEHCQQQDMSKCRSECV